LENELSIKAQAYRNSPEGKKAAQEAKARKFYCQAEVDRLLTFIPRQLDELVPWLAHFSEVADHVGVDFCYTSLASKLEAYGYAESAHVTKDKEAAKRWTRKQLGEYIVGQAIHCLRFNMPPHPLTQMFAEQYRIKEK